MIDKGLAIAGSILNKARIASGLTLMQVSSKALMKYQQLYKIEHGINPLPADRIILLARALKINKYTLVDAAVLDYKRKYEKKVSSSNNDGGAA